VALGEYSRLAWLSVKPMLAASASQAMAPTNSECGFLIRELHG
jgi:hypothetical protein